jgi:hypothetical protein
LLTQVGAGTARVEGLQIGADNDRLVQLAEVAGVRKVAIDAPFG